MHHPNLSQTLPLSLSGRRSTISLKAIDVKLQKGTDRRPTEAISHWKSKSRVYSAPLEFDVCASALLLVTYSKDGTTPLLLDLVYTSRKNSIWKLLIDWLGRRPLLIISSVLYFISGLVMIWTPNVYVLLLARLLDGFGIGLAVTLVPVYISETAPPEIRGSLNTLPQFNGSGGMFLSYCMVFGMSLMNSPSWRLMLGVISIPSLIYFVLTIFFLPESPRWFVSKGRMLEAKQVLQRLRGREDVAGLKKLSCSRTRRVQ